MSTTVFTKVEFSLSGLIEKIRLGEIALPDIQRPFVWPNTKVRNLFDSMLKGFPVGYLLFWANVVPEGVRHVGADLKQRVPSSLIVDGQQRLTSLYALPCTPSSLELRSCGTTIGGRESGSPFDPLIGPST